MMRRKRRRRKAMEIPCNSLNVMKLLCIYTYIYTHIPSIPEIRDIRIKQYK